MKQRGKRKEASVMKNTSQDGLWTASYGEIGATLKALEDQGITKEHLARLRVESDFARIVADFIVQNSPIEPIHQIHQKRARKIMGKNFFGIEEWSSFYGVEFSKKKLHKIAKFPWSENILNAPCPFHKGKKVNETHFAFLGLNTFKGKPLTIIRWQEIHPDSSQPKFYSYSLNSWYSQEKFANELTCDFRWYLMPLEIVPGSTSKIFREQTTILTPEYEVPLAIEEVTKVFLYYKKNGAYLNSKRYGRCRDVDSDGRRVDVGVFDSAGLIVSFYWGASRDDFIGVSSARKLKM